MQNAQRGKQNTGRVKLVSSLTMADRTILLRVGERTGSYPTLGYSLSGKTEKPITTLFTSPRVTVVATGNICTALDWLIRRIVWYAVVHQGAGEETKGRKAERTSSTNT